MCNRNGGDENGVNRRQALKTFGFWAISGIAAAVVGIPGIRFLIGNSQVLREPQWVDAGLVSHLPTPGEFIPVRYSLLAKDAWREVRREGLVWIGSSKEGQAFALSATCPHLGCLVRWRDDEGLFVCPCHTGKFDAEGNVVSGPPPGPLQRLDIMVEDDKVMVKV
ncbi:MAG: ubiquinol-cytochrome c reductase iron-sulfur subunit [SAR202 cluster bacterium]|nr:ubiquinol-cytochrome c reductase iron-sulfur subunit [SAR202 cluster bacterium]